MNNHVYTARASIFIISLRKFSRKINISAFCGGFYRIIYIPAFFNLTVKLFYKNESEFLLANSCIFIPIAGEEKSTSCIDLFEAIKRFLLRIVGLLQCFECLANNSLNVSLKIFHNILLCHSIPLMALMFNGYKKSGGHVLNHLTSGSGKTTNENELETIYPPPYM